ncbi:cysteine desulfurase family protein [Marinicrinis sediminis]|uniref:cysteine desulfurase n=1 Tax=Marinicrinis sediminis TaxID=1652465 RepID=A0ABW5R6N2_9BACL
MNRIYLDHAATTPLRPEVLEEMMTCYNECIGNPSSIHHHGRQARHVLNRSRDQIARLLGCKPAELIFTSGGTESDNLAILGAMEALSPHKKHLITCRTEHHAVLHACAYMETQGVEVTYLDVDQNGQLSLEELEGAIRPDTGLITILFGNNETGTVQPIEKIGHIAKRHDILFHVDAVQVLGALSLNLNELPVDYMSFSSHKINGPKGIGLLYQASHAPLQAQIHGGLQERTRRAGTENVAGIAGFAKAVALSLQDLSNKQQKMSALRLKMVEQLRMHVGEQEVLVNGHPEEHLPHILNVSFIGTQTEMMLMSLDMEGISVSSGSACTSGSFEVSHVLKAMHLPEARLASAIRISLGYDTTEKEIETSAKKIATVVLRMRNR